MAPLPESVLVVRLGAIGDVTNALVFAEAVRAHAPATRIGWVVHPLAQPLVEGHPAVDRVHLWRRRRAWADLPRLRRELRGEGYGLAVDLQRIAKSALVARLSGAPRVLGHDRGRSKEFSWLLRHEHIAPGDPRAHMVEHYLDFARHLGIEEPVVRHRLPHDPEADAWAADRISEWGGAPLVLAIGASKPANRWPAERFGELARGLASSGHPIVLVGGPDDRIAGQQASAAAQGTAVDLVGRTSLRQLVSLLRRARLVVSADSGPMHLAAACGRPVVAMFGPADPSRTGPWGAGHEILSVSNWDPGPPHRATAMEQLSVERVVIAAKSLLLGRE
jgi:heptosyltransferase-1